VWTAAAFVRVLGGVLAAAVHTALLGVLAVALTAAATTSDEVVHRPRANRDDPQQDPHPTKIIE
jgi:hypothetical protein